MTVIAGDCPEGWLMFEGKCYGHPKDNKLSWGDAESYCQSWSAGAHLASKFTLQKNKSLYKIIFLGIFGWGAVTLTRREAGSGLMKHPGDTPTGALDYQTTLAEDKIVFWGTLLTSSGMIITVEFKLPSCVRND